MTSMGWSVVEGKTQEEHYMGMNWKSKGFTSSTHGLLLYTSPLTFKHNNIGL